MSSGYFELKREIEREVRSAMKQCRQYVKQDHEMEVASYYEKEDPKNWLYERTGTLPNAATTTPVKESSQKFEFETYMDEGKIDYPHKGITVQQIIEGTNDGKYNTHGHHRYEERLGEDIEKDIRSAFLQNPYFS